ncbi:phosphoribosyl-AMP cyclohydrolase [Paucilactobacillus suebicus]|uniref:Phosphoribosyl-AMP cyclohydrolase n=1 Tax=Paucilactobacillus suebicus DSM 5007 = KCTC 3549 TaxID=1423807 RepID=A0A0R1WE17_9LACO|nr:phosphoribosyl-AMP cyclohydrolase [Paucilactobacillus suebicus]KRM12348.1 phosphoribosyl-AMP cyclohydrolase [Paucilactobacillus suebicus DSM 5007 = KCTC 3549]
MIQPRFDEKTGLMPAIIVDATTKDVLMMAYMNQESFDKTIETGTTWFWSRSRQTLWNKGESSGHTQTVKEIRIDCDLDTLVIKVDKKGPACHTNHESCFFRTINDEDETVY